MASCFGQSEFRCFLPVPALPVHVRIRISLSPSTLVFQAGVRVGRGICQSCWVYQAFVAQRLPQGLISPYTFDRKNRMVRVPRCGVGCA